MQLETWQVVVATMTIILGPTGAAWVLVNGSLNNIKTSVDAHRAEFGREMKEVKSDLKEFRATQLDNRERIIRLEEQRSSS